MFGYSYPIVRFCDWKYIDFLGFECLELRLDLKLEQFQELAVYLGVEPKCPQQRSFWRFLSCLFPVRSAPLSNGMRVSENHPRRTRCFWSKMGSGASFGRCWVQIVQDVLKSTSDWRPRTPFGGTWTLCGACWPHFQPAFNQILLQLELRRLTFSQFCRKCVICVFRCHSRAESLLLQVLASKSEPLATKSHTETVSPSQTSSAEQ